MTNDLQIGDIVDTNAPTGRWYKFGRIVNMHTATKTAKLEFPNGEYRTYYLVQLHKTEWKTLKDVP